VGALTGAPSTESKVPGNPRVSVGSTDVIVQVRRQQPAESVRKVQHLRRLGTLNVVGGRVQIAPLPIDRAASHYSDMLGLDFALTSRKLSHASGAARRSVMCRRRCPRLPADQHCRAPARQRSSAGWRASRASCATSVREPHHRPTYDAYVRNPRLGSR
jgi:hypothetical protein